MYDDKVEEWVCCEISSSILMPRSISSHKKHLSIQMMTRERERRRRWRERETEQSDKTLLQVHSSFREKKNPTTVLLDDLHFPKYAAREGGKKIVQSFSPHVRILPLEMGRWPQKYNSCIWKKKADWLMPSLRLLISSRGRKKIWERHAWEAATEILVFLFLPPSFSLLLLFHYSCTGLASVSRLFLITVELAQPTIIP